MLLIKNEIRVMDSFFLITNMCSKLSHNFYAYIENITLLLLLVMYLVPGYKLNGLKIYLCFLLLFIIVTYWYLPLFDAVLPDFAHVYSFIGSVFDPNTSGHLHKLKKMDPIDVETVSTLSFKPVLFF